jgi:outer membrane protein OmpA-like peptidoglycan-associated protein
MTARLTLAAVPPRDGPIAAADDAQTKRLADLLLEVARCVNKDVAAVLPSRLDEDLRLEALRSVLIEQERAALEKLQRKLDDPEQFAEAVSAVLASAFALAGGRDERLAAVIAPTMERATQASIRKDPSTLVGILYPLMGPVIRKSIAETLDGTLRGVNQALKHSLSWQGLKWRLEAYRSGASFADVVLKHTVVFRVEHLFLIHRKTGLLLEHVAAPQATAQDPHLVSSMLAAIQDFVRDSFTENGSGGAGGIDSVRLGDLLVWCEEGPSALLAAVIRGNPPDALHGVLRDTLAQIHEELRTALHDFNGDTAPMGDLAARLQACLQEQEQPREKNISPWLWALPLAVVLFLGIWAVQRSVEAHRVENYVQSLQQLPGVVVTRAERRDGKWHVAGLRDPLAADPANLLTQAGLDGDRVVGHWEPYQALNPAIVLRRISASLKPPPAVGFSLDGNTIRAVGTAPQHWVERARAHIAALPVGSPTIDLSGIKDIQDPTFVRLRDSIQSRVISFDTNAPRPADGQDEVLDVVASELSELIRVTKDLGFSVRFMIVGHADATGRETVNLSLSNARAEVVRSMLRARGVAPYLLTVRSAGTLEPHQTTAIGQSEATNRRVTFYVSTSD